MAWNDEPPKKEELTGSSWMDSPPSKAELDPNSGKDWQDRALDGALSAAGTALAPVAKVMSFVDSYSGSPVRAGVKQLTSGGDLGDAVSAYKNQLGEDPSKGPSGADIAGDLGVPETELPLKTLLKYHPMAQIYRHLPVLSRAIERVKNPTLRDAAGLAVDAATDPTTYIPIAGEAKALLTPGGKSIAGAAVKGAAKAAVPEAVVDTAKVAADATAEAVRNLRRSVSPDVSPRFLEYLETAKRNGIDPELLTKNHLYGDASTLAQAEKAKAIGPTGEPLRKRFDEGYNKIREALDGEVRKIGGGEPVDSQSAGQMLRDAYKKRRDKFFDDMDMTYDRITDRDVASGLMVDRDAMEAMNSKINGVEKYAKGLVKRGLPAEQSQGNQLLKIIESLREGNGSFKQAKESLRRLGKYAYGDYKPMMGEAPLDKVKVGELYDAYRDGMIETVRKHVSPEFADELVENNKAMTQWFRDNAPINELMNDHSISPEKVFEGILKSGDTNKIRALKSIMGDDPSLRRVKGSFLDSVSRVNKDGDIDYAGMLKALQNNDKYSRTVKEMFSPEELKNIEDLIKLGQGYGPSINTSNTAGATQFSKLKDSIKDSVFNDVVIDRLDAAGKRRLTGNPKASLEDIAEALRNGKKPEAPRTIPAAQKAQELKEMIERSRGRLPTPIPSRIPSAPFQSGGLDRVAESEDKKASPALLEQLRKNPSALNHIKDPGLREKLRQQLSEHAKERDPATEGVVTDQQSRDQYIGQ